MANKPLIYCVYRLDNVDTTCGLPIRSKEIESQDKGQYVEHLAAGYPRQFPKGIDQAQRYVDEIEVQLMGSLANDKGKPVVHHFDNKLIHNGRIHIKAVRKTII